MLLSKQWWAVSRKPPAVRKEYSGQLVVGASLEKYPIGDPSWKQRGSRRRRTDASYGTLQFPDSREILSEGKGDSKRARAAVRQKWFSLENTSISQGQRLRNRFSLISPLLLAFQIALEISAIEHERFLAHGEGLQIESVYRQPQTVNLNSDCPSWKEYIPRRSLVTRDNLRRGMKKCNAEGFGHGYFL